MNLQEICDIEEIAELKHLHLFLEVIEQYNLNNGTNYKTGNDIINRINEIKQRNIQK